MKEKIYYVINKISICIALCESINIILKKNKQINKNQQIKRKILHF